MIERLQGAFELYDLAVQMETQRLRRENPAWTEEQIRQGLKAWHDRRAPDPPWIRVVPGSEFE